MKSSPFRYHAPTTISEATSTLAELGDDAKVLAGGQSLIPMLALRLAMFDDLVDIGGVDELRGIEHRAEVVRIGAGTSDITVERDPQMSAKAPLVAMVTPFIGHFQIRTRGTVGGSIAHADPAAEYPAVAVALDATLELASTRGTRRVPAAEFFEGVWTTTAAPDEVLTAVEFPIWDGATGFGFEEFARRHGDYATAGALTAIRVDDSGSIDRCAITMFGVSGTPERAASLEADLLGTRPDDHDPAALGAAAVDTVQHPYGDEQAPAEYRTRVAREMVARAWRAGLADLAGGTQ